MENRFLKIHITSYELFKFIRIYSSFLSSFPSSITSFHCAASFFNLTLLFGQSSNVFRAQVDHMSTLHRLRAPEAVFIRLKINATKRYNIAVRFKYFHVHGLTSWQHSCSSRDFCSTFLAPRRPSLPAISSTIQFGFSSNLAQAAFNFARGASS